VAGLSGADAHPAESRAAASRHQARSGTGKRPSIPRSRPIYSRVPDPSTALIAARRRSCTAREGGAARAKLTGTRLDP
jgi:hypothetical protein